MSSGRVVVRSLGVLLCLVLLGALVPAAVLGAPEDGPRNYIVRLDVLDAGKVLRPGNRTGRQRIRLRAERTSAATDRIVAAHGVRLRHRYTAAISGFSARMTSQQAAEVAADPKVASVSLAQRVYPAAQVVPDGVKRVKAWPEPGAPDVDVDVAVLDTGIGPAGGGELNVQGGVNCSGDSRGTGAGENPWDDFHFFSHGTHVAGTIAARDNGIGVVGIAPGARLWSARVFGAGGYGDETDVACGLDWAVSTLGPLAPPGTQPIDVINMSIDGPRSPGPESCAALDVYADPSPLHEAVCAAYRSGITMVAAAGNAAMNANASMPGGYDQVISVGAISDSDGVGGGDGPMLGCSDAAGNVDDAYADYSNYGPEVDIIAPGSCILSTRPGAAGDTQVMSGTSMSTAHVSGAVARYLAAHPGTSPDRMRELVRAAGRLDWDLRSDPRWSGPDDFDEPNRVLDVKALLDAPDVRVWLSQDGFRVGGRDTSRRTRVDIQRIGGYEGTVNLGVTGLPGAATASFDRPGISLAGLTGLGARLKLWFPTDGPSGSFDSEVTGSGPGGDPFGSRPMHLVLDRIGPVVTNLGPKVKGGGTLVGALGATQAWLQWQVTDEHSDVKTAILQRKIATGAWRPVASGSLVKAKVTMKPGQVNRFRVRSTDTAGNASYSPKTRAQLVLRDSSSGRWLRPASGGWTTQVTTAAHGRSLLIAIKPAAGISTQFWGIAAAVVAPVGPNRGVLRVRVDGGDWHLVDLGSSEPGHQRVVYSTRLVAGLHVIEIEGYEGSTAIDGLLFIR